MPPSLSILKSLRRPRILVRAARFGLHDYCRERDLKRLMHLPFTPAPEKALDGLIVQEEALEATRKAGDASYSVARHVEVLIALLAEASLLPRPDSAS